MPTRTNITAHLLLAVAVLVAAAGVAVAAVRVVGHIDAQSPTPAENCTAKGLGFCSPYGNSGPCYNASTQTCCITSQWTCHVSVTCNNTDEFCCMPWYGCEYAGMPRCCGKDTQCCGARHASMCAPKAAKCCTSGFYPGYCMPGTQCCPTHSGSQCCGPEQSCCTDYMTDRFPACCPSTQLCNTTGGPMQCVNVTASCTTKPGLNVTSATLLTRERFISVSQCCKLCFRINAGLWRGRDGAGTCAVAVAEQLGEFEFDCRVYNETGSRVPSANRTTWVVVPDNA